MRMARYTAVSAFSIVLTQILLVAFSLAGMAAAVANLAAVLLAAIPAFVLNRRWTWGDRTDRRLNRQIAIFWTTIAVGLIVSTAAVWVTSLTTTAPQALAAANLAAFALLWAARFVVLDRLAFVDTESLTDDGGDHSWRGYGRKLMFASPAIAAVGAAVVVHGWGMNSYPARFDDEGTYVSQAWSVMAHGELSHYTYWYDHPPVGWIQLVPWLWLSGGFERATSAVAAGREVMLFVHFVTAALIYVWARRLNMARGFAAAAVLLFSLSPLALYWQRQVLLDNLGVMWAIAAFVLARSPERRLSAHAGAGACFAMAVLSKETFLLLLPALALELWRATPRETRRYSFAVTGSLLSSVVLFYPLMALLRGELFPGEDHVSLWNGIAFQLFDREGSGFVLDQWSNANNIVEGWLTTDPWLLGAGALLVPVALVMRRLRPAALALGISLVMLLRSGYLPVPYLIVMLPFAAMTIAGVGDGLWAWMMRRYGSPARGVVRTTVRLSGRAVAAAALGAMVFVTFTRTAPAWANTLDRQLAAEEDGPTRQAEAWLRQNVPRSGRLLVDNTIWLDLIVDGYDRERVVWYYKLDLDPAVAKQFPGRWRDFDYLVSTEGVRSTQYLVPSVDEALKKSTIAATFGDGVDRIEIRRISKER